MPSAGGLLVAELEGDAESLTLEIYSPGYSLCLKAQFGAAGPGVNYLPLNATALPSGLIYARLTAQGHGAQDAKTAKVLILR
jgi:hypothetical protein